MNQAALILTGAIVGVVADRLVGPRLDALFRSMRRWFRRRRSSRLTPTGIVSIAGADLVVRYANVSAGWAPEQVRIVSQGARPDVSELLGRSPLRQLLPEADEIQAEVERLRRAMGSEDDAQWNGDHLGPTVIDQSRDDGAQYIRVETDIRDWATHRVMRRLVAEATQGAAGAGESSRLREVDPLTSTTLRLFLTVLTADRKVVIGRRGIKEGIDCPDTLCSAVESWVHANDVVSGRVDLRAVVDRALVDQLGLVRSDSTAPDLRFHTVVMNLRTRNWAILGLVDLQHPGVDSTDLTRLRSLAPPDLYWIADPLEFIPLRRKEVRTRLKDDFAGWMPEAALCFRNSLALQAPGLLPRDGSDL
jgi:hypothetical protein